MTGEWQDDPVVKENLESLDGVIVMYEKARRERDYSAICLCLGMMHGINMNVYGRNRELAKDGPSKGWADT